MVRISTLGCHVLCFIQYLKRIEWKNNLFNVKCYIWWALARKDNRWIIFRKKYLDVVRLKLHSFMIYRVVSIWTKKNMYKSVRTSNIKSPIFNLEYSNYFIMSSVDIKLYRIQPTLVANL